jgi:hypothetical protein
MPSGHTPADAYEYPVENGGDPNLLVAVPEEAIHQFRDYLTEEVGSREEWLSWYTREFAEAAEATYEDIGSPEMTLQSAWDVFGTMAPVVAGLL